MTFKVPFLLKRLLCILDHQFKSPDMDIVKMITRGTYDDKKMPSSNVNRSIA
jgi:hypothetical protein